MKLKQKLVESMFVRLLFNPSQNEMEYLILKPAN